MFISEIFLIVIIKTIYLLLLLRPPPFSLHFADIFLIQFNNPTED